MKTKVITARDILALLRTKHSADVFVSECKTGATWGYAGDSGNGKMRKLDGWAMEKSWANPFIAGYEIKIHRGDFLQDEKWQNYLDFCNEFYFVCPTNLIQKDELPAEVGLMYVSKTGTMLYTKKKAQRRLNVKIPNSIFRYILMNRVQVIDNVVDNRDYTKLLKEEKLRFWKKWVKDRKLDVTFGAYVSKAIQETIRQEITRVRMENDQLKVRNESLQGVKDLLASLGLDKGVVGSWNWKEKIKEKIEMINKGIPDKDLMDFLQGTIQNLQKIQNIYQEK